MMGNGVKSLKKSCSSCFRSFGLQLKFKAFTSTCSRNRAYLHQNIRYDAVARSPIKDVLTRPKSTLYLINWPVTSRNFIAFNLVRKADF
jgi:hypothetical protein